MEFRSRDAARRAAKDADDAEVAALAVGVGSWMPIEEALFDDLVSEEVAEQRLNSDIAPTVGEADDSVAESVAEDVQSEAVLVGIESVMEARGEILGDLYPFRLERGRLQYRNDANSLVYELCLAIAHAQDKSSGRFRNLQIAFERLAGVAVSKLVTGSRVVRTGYPPGEHATDEPGYIARVVELMDKAMPDRWSMDDVEGSDDWKDGGVDSIVFRTLDRRAGSVILAGNCGCGKNWLAQNKHRERPSEKLATILTWPKPTHLIDFFAVPYHVVDRRDWLQGCQEGRIFLDRLRLTTLLGPEALPRGLADLQAALQVDVPALIQSAVRSFTLFQQDDLDPLL